MESRLEEHMAELKASGYRPRMLAVDEFAIHKGHTYATCVMDLETGEVLWVGEGRSKEDFERFFTETDPAFLTDVMAVAMDMNASYDILVRKHLPDAKIVYDRYHMQAQFGKDVLGVVRLNEARAHKEKADALRESAFLRWKPLFLSFTAKNTNRQKKNPDWNGESIARSKGHAGHC